jgi:hypothetical protein
VAALLFEFASPRAETTAVLVTAGWALGSTRTAREKLVEEPGLSVEV